MRQMCNPKYVMDWLRQADLRFCFVLRYNLYPHPMPRAPHPSETQIWLVDWLLLVYWLGPSFLLCSALLRSVWSGLVWSGLVCPALPCAALPFSALLCPRWNSRTVGQERWMVRV